MILTALTGKLLQAFDPQPPKKSYEQRKAEISKDLTKAFDELAKTNPNNYAERRKAYLRKNGLPDNHTLRPSGRLSAFHREC